MSIFCLLICLITSCVYALIVVVVDVFFSFYAHELRSEHSLSVINRQGHCFGGAGYVGVGDPQFFYASISALTLGKILRLLGSTIEIPPPIAATGFPEGAQVNLSTTKKTLLSAAILG